LKRVQDEVSFQLLTRFHKFLKCSIDHSKKGEIMINKRRFSQVVTLFSALFFVSNAAQAQQPVSRSAKLDIKLEKGHVLNIGNETNRFELEVWWRCMYFTYRYDVGKYILPHLCGEGLFQVPVDEDGHFSFEPISNVFRPLPFFERGAYHEIKFTLKRKGFPNDANGFWMVEYPDILYFRTGIYDGSNCFNAYNLKDWKTALKEISFTETGRIQDALTSPALLPEWTPCEPPPVD
jgi:hypothetical protein